MKNLLKETESVILESGHTPKDIRFIGSEHSGHCCTWEQFKTIADVDYYSGFGGQNVACDLVIIFKDKQRMWRGEYDGSEWWEFSKPFVMPKVKRAMTRVVRRGYESDLEEMNGPLDD